MEPWALYLLFGDGNPALMSTIAHMNQAGAAGRSAPSAYATATARHICAHGCQLVVENAAIAAGQTLQFHLSHSGTVKGTVRWVVRDRAGFAFDHPLSGAMHTALMQGSRAVRAVDLYLV